MKYILTIFIIIFSLTLCSCNKAQSEDKNKENTNETILFAMNTSLFNSIENLIYNISQKKYIDSYDSLEEIYTLTSKAKIASETDPLATNFIKTLDKLSENINTMSNNQKTNEIIFEYEKSQLSLLANIKNDSGGEGNLDKAEGQGSGNDNKSEQDSKGSSSGGSTSGEDNKSTVIIPEEEALKKYPEILITKQDNEISSYAIDLLDYISKKTLESEKENLTAIINREKYLLYKIEILAKLDKYEETSELILEAQNNYNSLYLKIDEKSQEDIVSLSNILKSIKSSLDEKNSTAIELQVKVAIELMKNLSSKTKD